MRVICSYAFAVLLLALSAATAGAQETNVRPIFSMERVSAGVSADYCGFQSAGEQALPLFSKSWEFGLVGSYNLVAPAVGERGPMLSLTAASAYDVDNKWFRHRLGLRLTLFKGGRY